MESFMDDTTFSRIRDIFLSDRPSFALFTAAGMLGMSLAELRKEIGMGAIVAVSSGVGQRVSREEMVAAAMRKWEQGVIEEALGIYAPLLLPEAIRLVELRARVPQYQRDMLRVLAERQGTSVDDVLSRELEGIARVRQRAAGERPRVRGGDGVARERGGRSRRMRNGHGHADATGRLQHSSDTVTNLLSEEKPHSLRGWRQVGLPMPGFSEPGVAAHGRLRTRRRTKRDFRTAGPTVRAGSRDLPSRITLRERQTVSASQYNQLEESMTRWKAAASADQRSFTGEVVP
jgi:hypothetical protein